ncbi:MAG TPA: glycosyltransferase family 39 protein [Thermoanaerobaculia bacterium]|nr:glycosyltransferase family 39 protein [Thermoanaerobaculia bacterium]
MSRLSDRSVLGLLLILAALPRLALLDRQGLWVDEVFSLAIATGHSLEHPAAEARPELGDYAEPAGPARPAAFRRYLQHDDPPAGPARVVRAVFLSDTSPPLYYLLLWAWTLAVGTGDAALRLFSAAWSLACVPLLWAIGREVGGRPAAIAAGLLFAAAPVSLYYSTEGRMYSLLWFCACLFAWATLRLAREGPRVPFLLVWIVAAAAGVLTHYFFAFVAAACAGWLLFRPVRLPRIWPLAGGGAAALLASPWLLRVPDSLFRWRVTQGWLDGLAPSGVILLAPAKLAWSFVSTRGHWGNPPYTEVPVIGVLAALALAVLVAGAWRRLFEGPAALLWLWLVASCLGPVVFDLLLTTHTVEVDRYALAGFPAAILLVAAAVAALRPPALRLAFPALILIAWLPGAWDVFHNTARHGNSFREVAALLERRTRPGDLAIVSSIPSGVLGIARYLGDGPEILSWVEQLGRRSVPGGVAKATAGRPAVVLVVVHTVGAPVPEEAWLRDHAELKEESQMHAARLLFLGPPEPAGRSLSLPGERRRAAPSAPGRPAPPARRSAH